MEAPSGHIAHLRRERVRYVVIIDADNSAIARLLSDARQQVAEFEGGAPEVVQMVQGLIAAKVANGSEWDVALQGHSTLERLAADVYTLDL